MHRKLQRSVTDSLKSVWIRPKRSTSGPSFGIDCESSSDLPGFDCTIGLALSATGTTEDRGLTMTTIQFHRDHNNQQRNVARRLAAHARTGHCGRTAESRRTLRAKADRVRPWRLALGCS